MQASSTVGKAASAESVEHPADSAQVGLKRISDGDAVAFSDIVVQAKI